MMKMIGAAFVILGCGGIGFYMAANHRQEEKNLRQLIAILNFMECELQYRLTPLPELCRQAAKEFPGMLGKSFLNLAIELDAQISPDVETCMSVALDKVQRLTAQTRQEMLLLGQSVGRFDLNGQIKGLEAVRQDCRRKLEELSNNRENRLRSYQTLGLCAGAALAILFI